MKTQDKIVLVNDEDEIIGEEEKMKVHEKGLLHRAFSIIIFNSKNELLIQKRASSKYHSGGLWTNACCSHQKLGKELHTAAKERLFEEMGIECDLKEIFTFRYYTQFKNGLTENEIDHVFLGKSDEKPRINIAEAEDYKWISIEELQKDIAKFPENYTVWFKILIQKYMDETNKNLKFFSEILKIKSNSEFEILNITNDIKKCIKNFKIKEGFLNIFSKHTTLAIKINEDEPLLRKDFSNFLSSLSKEKKYFHDDIKLRKNCLENEPKNAKGHLNCLVLETSQTIPISNYLLQLGKYQDIFAIETSGSREREIVVQVVGY